MLGTHKPTDGSKILDNNFINHFQSLKCGNKDQSSKKNATQSFWNDDCMCSNFNLYPLLLHRQTLNPQRWKGKWSGGKQQKRGENRDE